MRVTSKARLFFFSFLLQGFARGESKRVLFDVLQNRFLRFRGQFAIAHAVGFILEIAVRNLCRALVLEVHFKPSVVKTEKFFFIGWQYSFRQCHCTFSTCVYGCRPP